LDPPLGVPKPNIVALVSFNLPIARGDKIHCLDILHSLVKYVLGHVEDTEDFRKVRGAYAYAVRLAGVGLHYSVLSGGAESNTELIPLDVLLSE